MQTIKRLPLWGAYALLAYMPFHIFLSQWLGTSFGGLEGFKIAKDVVAIVLLILTVILTALLLKRKDYKPYVLIVVLSVIYAGFYVATYLANKSTSLDVAGLGSTYNNRYIWIFIITALGGLLVKKRPSPSKVIKVTIIVSTIICIIGLIQWFLPTDILVHFGYAKELGVKPNFFINEDPAFPRVFATLRDPNSLGALLLIPIMLLVAKIQGRDCKKRNLVAGILALHMVVLYLTFSRAAWGGLLIAFVVYQIITHKQKSVELLKRYWPVLVVLVVLVGVTGYSLRNTNKFKSIVLRKDHRNTSQALDSDGYHLEFIKEGLRGIKAKPFGHGPGTAGIVSIHNGNKGQLTENYYVQIGYEVGIAGLVLFMAIWLLVIRMVYMSTSPYKDVLLATVAAYAVMALTMHLWSNEAVAYTWWGLAGLSLGAAGVTPKKAAKLKKS